MNPETRIGELTQALIDVAELLEGILSGQLGAGAISRAVATADVAINEFGDMDAAKKARTNRERSTEEQKDHRDSDSGVKPNSAGD